MALWDSSPAKDLKDTIFQYVQDIGCCIRCTLRVMGENEYKTFLFKENVIEKFRIYCSNKDASDEEQLILDIEQPVAKKIHISPCICCLGALQLGVSEKVIGHVLTDLKLSGYQFQKFQIQLTLPPTVELREHLLLNHLEEKFSVVYTPTVISTIASVRDVFKWSYGPRIGRTFQADFDPFCNFAISLYFTQQNFEKECEPLEQLSPNDFPNRNRKSKSLQERYSRSSILKALTQVNWKKLKETYSVPPEVPTIGIEFKECTFRRDSIYLAGRYMKFSRNLSQTPWFIEGEKKFKNSVEEIIVETIKKYIQAKKIVFSASGREDVDVRMLGKGRPFILELMDARKTIYSKEEFKTMQLEINLNTDVEVRDLQRTEKIDIQKLKEGEELKKKLYSALCCLKRPLTDEDLEKLDYVADLVVQQKTPIRVLHRRNLAVREKVIYSVAAEKIDDFRFRIKILTQAGTYVKEFVHGDFGRTVPNIGTILNTDADIIELDVEEIQTDWPPEVD